MTSDGGATDPGGSVSDDTDTSPENVDRAFRAILEGLRTTLPGTQALFGFLLILPFQGSFGDLDTITRTGYYVAFIAAGISTALLIAPSAHQRMRAPLSGVRRRSERHLKITVWVTIWGTVAFAVSLTAAVFIVSELVLGSTPGAAVAALVAGIVAWTWFWMPLVTFRRVD